MYVRKISVKKQENEIFYKSCVYSARKLTAKDFGV